MNSIIFIVAILHIRNLHRMTVNDSPQKTTCFKSTWTWAYCWKSSMDLGGLPTCGAWGIPFLATFGRDEKFSRLTPWTSIWPNEIMFHQPIDFPEYKGELPLQFTTIWGPTNSCFRSRANLTRFHEPGLVSHTQQLRIHLATCDRLWFDSPDNPWYIWVQFDMEAAKLCPCRLEILAWKTHIKHHSVASRRSAVLEDSLNLLGFIKLFQGLLLINFPAGIPLKPRRGSITTPPQRWPFRQEGQSTWTMLRYLPCWQTCDFQQHLDSKLSTH